jgi:hypothetical protein
MQWTIQKGNTCSPSSPKMVDDRLIMVVQNPSTTRAAFCVDTLQLQKKCGEAHCHFHPEKVRTKLQRENAPSTTVLFEEQGCGDQYGMISCSAFCS